MIDIFSEALKYASRVHMIDPRCANVIEKTKIVFEDMGTKGGYQRGWIIALNPHATDEHQRETLGHELAHLLDEQIFSNHSSRGCTEGHGVGWSFWMRKLGLSPERFHTHEELMRLSSRVFQIRCLDCGMTSVRTYDAIRCPIEECNSPDVKTTKELSL